MITDVIMLVLSLGFILFACFIFTNAIEWFGKKLNLGQGVIGSVFAAIGTGLPETIIPIIAIIFYKGGNAKEIGIGAIAGAPFMLGTLAFFVSGLAVIIFSLIGRRTTKMLTDIDVISRDLMFFIIIYGVAVLTSFIHTYVVIKTCIAVVLLLSYMIYLKTTFSDEAGQVENVDKLYFTRFFKVKTSMFWIVIQLIFALMGIIFGADLFVKYVESLADSLGIAPLILSMIITPIATELPEKLNSVIWIGHKKDTLALGNITGAMVFQSCFPVVFGIIFTPWNLTGITMLSAVLALTSAALNLVWIRVTKSMSPYVLLGSGALYVIFLINVF